MRSRRAVIAGVLVVATASWAVPAHAGPPANAVPDAGPPANAPAAVPGGFASWDELFAMQLRLIGAADEVTAAARAAAAGTLDGLAGISARPERRELWVYWKGGTPASVSRAIDAARARVPVRVLPARFSEREMLAAVTVVMGQPGVTAAAPRTDGSGVSASTTGSVAAVVDAAAVRATGVAVQVAAERPVLASRQSSNAPHYGGAKFTRPVEGGNAMCTTGFAVWQGRGAKRMLTAGHCAADGDTVYSGTGAVMGTVTGDNNTKDLLLINTSSGGSTYNGSWNSNTSKPVYTVISNYVDTLVCTSGAMTGQHCNIRVKTLNNNINVLDENGGVYLITGLVKAEQDNHTVAVGQGDSGGPVVAQDSQFGFVLNYPLGTITAIDSNTTVACGSSYAPTTCAWRMYYADINNALAYYNATIMTG